LNIILPHNELESSFLSLSISYGGPHYDLAKKAQGKSIVHLYIEDLKEVSIVFPSKEEQTKIASMILSIDNLITLHQREP